MAKPHPRGEARTPKAQRLLLREYVDKNCAARPGVYRMLSEDGYVLYVGKSKRLRDRLLGYFRAKRHQKGAQIVKEAKAIDWEYTPNEFAALLLELRLIKQYRPPHNVAQKRDVGHYAFIRLTDGAAPKLTVSKGSAEGGGYYYGPFIGPNLVALAARDLSDVFGLRDCSDLIPLQFRSPNDSAPPPKLRAPDCIRHEVGKCLGPCIKQCTSKEYEECVLLARAFLEGSENGPIDQFQREMVLAKNTLAYERAALYRDRLLRLTKLQNQLPKIRIAIESLSFVYPVAGYRGDDRIYIIKRGTLRADVPKPKGTLERMELQRAIERIFAEAPIKSQSVRSHEVEEILIMTSWFQNHPEELKNTWVP